MMPFAHVLLTFLIAPVVSLVGSVPISSRDVFAPPVTYPHNGVVWYCGDRYNVTWDTSNPPEQITNNEGTIILSHNGRLLLDHSLADGFNIMDGRVEVEVPNVKVGNKYSIVLLGDSGNQGETFRIARHT
ncbi:hypothetical protein E1B28_012291 [Marasmius oreades]|uniref:Uncharacterized protein n=1 Tax=Marasmius oreades TaxID=181124 RepID=A0A9P7UNJ2_9AGAR|nr:uncharacterized protein E1B28_012291 [Marasmius oreades]KAG7088278.1 hypothetical protein E1B28_012291 [Marasmius oreades]